VLGCAIVYILLIIEHNWDVSPEKKIVYPENNLSVIAIWYVCAVRSEPLNVVQLELTFKRVSMIQ